MYNDKKGRFELVLSNFDCNATEFIAKGMAKKYGDIFTLQHFTPS